MNKIATFWISILGIGVTNLAMAQVKTPAPVKQVSVSSNPTHNLNFRLRQDMMQIQKDLHSGKLTKGQADSNRAQVLAIRKQELADMKANGNHQLTADQQTQLGQQLTQLEGQL